MNEPVGSVAPITLAQSLAHTQLTSLGARIAAGFATELGRARADVAFSRNVPAIAPVLAVPANDLMQARALSTVADRYATLGAHEAEAARRARADSRISRRDSDDRRGRGRDGRPPDDSSSDGDEMRGTSVTLPSYRLAAIDAGLERYARLVADAAETGQPVVCVLPGTGLLDADDGSPVAIDIVLLCLAFDGSLGARRQVWGCAFGDDRCVATFDGRWDLDDGSIGSRASGSWQMSLASADRTRSSRAPLQCVTRERTWCGLRLARDNAYGACEPEHWLFQCGAIAWA